MKSSILNQRLRRIIMLSWVIIFIMVAPLVIFYTAGYRYDFKNGRIQETGVISIDAKPQNMQIYLNNVLIDDKLPIRLANRAPGVYNISLSMDGYQPWNKEITVESKKTTYIKNISLIKKSAPEAIYQTKSKIIDAYFSHNGRYALILEKKNNFFEVHLLNTETKKIIPISRGKLQILPTIDWSIYGNNFTIIYKDEQKTNLELFDAVNLEGRVVYQADNNLPIYYQWSKSSLPAIYLNNNGYITENNLTNAHKVIGKVSSAVWITDGENIWEYNDKIQGIIKNGTLVNNRKFSANLNKFIAVNDDRLVGANDQKMITIKYDSENYFLNEIPTSLFLINPDKNEILAWSPWELWVIYKDGNVALLNRRSEEIKYVSLLDQYGVVLLANNLQMDAFNPGYYTDQNILTNVQIDKMSVSIETKNIFFFGKVEQTTGFFSLSY